MPTSLTLHIYGATNSTEQTTAEQHKQEKRSAFKSNTSKSLMIKLEYFSLIPAFSFVKLTKFFSISVKGFGAPIYWKLLVQGQTIAGSLLAKKWNWDFHENSANLHFVLTQRGTVR